MRASLLTHAGARLGAARFSAFDVSSANLLLASRSYALRACQCWTRT